MIQFNHICKSFDKKQIFKDFCLTVNIGDKLLIRGKSGIGKSTLFRLLMGFELPDEGEIVFNGIKIDEQTVWGIRQKLAWVSQDVVLGMGTVRQLIHDTFALKINQSFRNKAIAMLPDLLSGFELDLTLLDKEIGTLSGGERQRMALVLALMLQRKVFLLDEFTSALDKELKVKVMNYFFSRKDLTVIAISHDEIIPEYSNIRSIILGA